jgi:hypothetical protein
MLYSSKARRLCLLVLSLLVYRLMRWNRPFLPPQISSRREMPRRQSSYRRARLSSCKSSFEKNSSFQLLSTCRCFIHSSTSGRDYILLADLLENRYQGRAIILDSGNVERSHANGPGQAGSSFSRGYWRGGL